MKGFWDFVMVILDVVGIVFGSKIHEKTFKNVVKIVVKSNSGGGLSSSWPPSGSRRFLGWLQGRSWGPRTLPGSLLRRLTGPCWCKMVPKRLSEAEGNRHENWIVFAWLTEVVFFYLVVLGRQKDGS